ncbi:MULTISPECIES: hypothetical protein [Sporomusaceae]|uniref:hypothetical protein n=1 Tax=Sporomusaceae TaxID=1843490 RepID=UPI0008FC0843|nr:MULTISPECIES: hypothetical protein [Sporomusaceae]
MKNIFVDSILKKLEVRVTFNSHEKGEITRTCIPFDYGPSRRSKDQSDKYHFYDLDSPDGKHTLSILPNQIKSIVQSENHFDPGQYVKWTPNWFIERDWGPYS